MITTDEFLIWFLSVVIFGVFSDAQVDGLNVVLYPSESWRISYVIDVRLDSIEIIVDLDTAIGFGRRADLSREVGASATIHRGNIFRSYAAFHFETFLFG